MYAKLGFEIVDLATVNYTIRNIREGEYGVLDAFLYEAIFVPDGADPPPRGIINQPELQVYVADFGKHKGDRCMVAESDNKIIGAAWARIMDDYGYVDNETPSLAISLYPEYRSLGIGTALMQAMLDCLKAEGYEQTSLSVQKENYAVRMYTNLGFEIVDESEEEYIMVCKL